MNATTDDLTALRELAKGRGLGWGIDTDNMPATCNGGAREIGRIIIRVNQGRTESFTTPNSARRFIMEYGKSG